MAVWWLLYIFMQFVQEALWTDTQLGQRHSTVITWAIRWENWVIFISLNVFLICVKAWSKLISLCEKVTLPHDPNYCSSYSFRDYYKQTQVKTWSEQIADNTNREDTEKNTTDADQKGNVPHCTRNAWAVQFCCVFNIL